jgi:hypothetical protein
MVVRIERGTPPLDPFFCGQALIGRIRDKPVALDPRDNARRGL